MLRTALGLMALLGSAHAAGMTTHTLAGYRAISYFGRVMHSGNASRYNRALEQNKEAVIAGSDFPDFLYACGKYQDHHDAGEFAHWPTFHKAMVQYIRDTQPMAGNWSDDTNRLVAFLMGAGVHFMADELWEGMTGELGSGQGMVRVVSSLNLAHDGKSDNDEVVANMAADFYLPWALDMGAIHPWRRVYPLEDVFNVYTKYTKFTDVTMLSLTNCHILFDLGLWAEKSFGALLFVWYAEMRNKVPVVAERLIDLPLGGIDDMAVWASYVWERLAGWIDNGPPDNAPPRRASTDADQDDRYTHDLLSRFEPFVDQHAEITALSPSTPLFRWRDPAHPLNGVVYTGPAHLELTLGRMLAQMVSAVLGEDAAASLSIGRHEPEQEDKLLVVPEPAAPSAQGGAPVSYAGAAVAVADLDADGIQDTVWSEYGSGQPGRPMVGAVVVQYGGGKTQRLVGENLHSWFGKTLAVIDMNADGLEDLVVGAPHASFNDTESEMPFATEAHFRLWGKVYVYFGRSGGMADSPDLTIRTSSDLTALGWVLQPGDLNGDRWPDLLIGCPLWSGGGSNQQGQLFGVLASPELRTGRVIEIDSQADLHLVGPSNYDWFGHSVAVLPAADLMLIGAPGHRVNGSAVGAVYLYARANGSWAQSGLVVGSDPLGEFGHAIAVDGNGSQATVAASAPAAGALRSGKVYVMKAGELSQGGPVAGLGLQATVSGSGMLGRAGWLVQFADCNADGQADLVVASPMQNKLLEVEAGAVAVWLSPVSGDTATSRADWRMEGSRKGGRTGSAFASLGDGRVVVGSPRATVDDMEMAGYVEVVNVSRH